MKIAKLDATTLLLLVFFTPLFIFQLITIFFACHAAVYRINVSKPQWTTNQTHLSQQHQQHHLTHHLWFWLRSITETIYSHVTLVKQDSSSNKENDGRLVKTEECINDGNHKPQVLPTNVTPPPRAGEWTDPGSIISSGAAQEHTNSCPVLHKISEERGPIYHWNVDHLRTVDDITARITDLTRISGILIKPAEWWHLAKLWILLKDNWFTIAVIKEARAMFNWHCTKLITWSIHKCCKTWMPMPLSSYHHLHHLGDCLSYLPTRATSPHSCQHDEWWYFLWRWPLQCCCWHSWPRSWHKPFRHHHHH